MRCYTSTLINDSWTCLLSETSRPVVGDTKSPVQCVLGIFSYSVNLLKCEADHSPKTAMRLRMCSDVPPHVIVAYTKTTLLLNFTMARAPYMYLPIYYRWVNANQWWTHFYSLIKCIKTSINTLFIIILNTLPEDGPLIIYPYFLDILNVQPLNILLLTVWHNRLCSSAWDCRNCV